MPTIAFLLRRLLAQRLMALAVIVTLGFSIGVLVAGPIYADGAREAILSSAVGSAGVTVRNARFGVYGDGAFPLFDADAAAEAALGNAPVETLVRQARSTAALVLDAEPRSIPLLMRTGIDEHLRFDGRVPSAPGEVAMYEPAAATAGLEAGDTLVVVAPDGRRAELRLTGTYAAPDRGDPFWYGSQAPWPAPESPEPYPLVLGPEGYLDLAARLELTSEFVWDAYLAFAGLPFERAERLPADLGEALASMRGTASLEGIQLATGLPALLDVVRGRVTDLRVPILLVVFQIGAVGLAVLAGVGALTVERQSFELAVLHSRGFSRGRLLLGQGLQAGIVALASFPVGIGLGLLLARLATYAAGPQPPGTSFPIRVSASALVAGAVGAAVGAAILLALSIPVVSRTILEERRRRSREERPLLARVPAELVALPLGLAAFWEVRRSGLQPSLRTGAIDPLVLLAPTLLLFAASFLALRLLLWTLRRLDHRIGAIPRLSGYLAGRRLGRAPGTSFATALLLLLAVGLLVVSSTYRGTLTRNHADAARQEVGSDWRVVIAAPEDPIAALGRLPDGATGVLRGEPDLDGGSFRLPPQALAIDPAAYAVAGWWRGDFADASLDELLGRLTTEPPGEAAPPGTTGVRISITGDPAAAGLRPVVTAIAPDGSVRRAVLDGIRPEGPSGSQADLDLPNGGRVLSLSFVVPDGAGEPDRFRVAIGELTLLGAEEVPLELSSWTPMRWRGGTGETTSSGIRGRILEASSGTSDVVGGLVAPSPPLPAIVSPGIANGREEAFDIALGGQRLSLRRVGAAEDFPSLSSGREFVVTSAPALLAAFVRIPDANLSLTEVWARGDDPRPVLRELGFLPGRTLRADRIESTLAQLPQSLAVGMHVTAAAGGLGLVVIGVAVALSATQRRRGFEFAALRAMGVEGRAVGRILLVEQAVLLGFSLAVGFGLGYLVLRLMMPYAARSLGVGFPEPVLVLDAAALAASVLAIAVTTGVGLALAARALLRASVTGVLRGEAE